MTELLNPPTKGLDDAFQKAKEIIGIDDISYILSGSDETYRMPEHFTFMPTKIAYEKNMLFKPPYELTDRIADMGEIDGGVFLYVPKGMKLTDPISACFLVSLTNQKVVNQLVLDEGAEAHIIMGCAAQEYVSKEREHISVTEIYLMPGAKLTYTMIHSWDEAVAVYPKTGGVLGKNSELSLNYIALKPIRDLRSNPRLWLDEGAVANLNSIVFLKRGQMDLGGEVYLKGQGAKGFIVSRVVTDKGKVTSRGFISAEAKDTVGHIECDGLMLSPTGGQIVTLPGLSTSVDEVNLTHEASLGKLSEQELEWLIAKGFSKEEAEALILGGFLDISQLNLPKRVEEEVRRNIQGLEFSM